MRDASAPERAQGAVRRLGRAPILVAELDTERRFEMNAFSDSYVLRVLLAQRSTGPFKAVRRLRWLRTPLVDAYRPKLHYMRGPGPKWQEKRNAGRELSLLRSQS
jgi:hypothetical protein